MNIIYNIQKNEQLRALPPEDIPALCNDIRQFLLEKVSRTGGHLASNLGVVELTVALHRVYDPMKDRILFDVGHQAYVHKILTGRREAMDGLRQFGGISGFPKPCESAADPFIAGHASDSVSIALGMARARSLRREDYDVVAVIGDGALTGGLSFEGLSDAGASGEPMVIVLNDNGMSINRSVGGVATLLRNARTRQSYIRFKQAYRRFMRPFPRAYLFLHRMKERIRTHLIPSGMFDELGLAYIGPVDGHNERSLETVLRWARDLQQPVVVHVVTKKGKGYKPAEQNPELFHGVNSFDLERGVTPCSNTDFSACFGAAASELAAEDETVCAITAAMKSGTGLDDFAKNFPNRFFELGISEEHAVSMCAGMAKQGLKPIFAVYSTFLQRSYDMLIENLGIMDQHVVLGVDRAGLVGHDGVTHHGCFDLAYLSSVPNMTILAPSSYIELRHMLRKAVLEEHGCVALRYPRGEEGRYKDDSGEAGSVLLRPGKDVTILCHGIQVNDALDAAEILAAQGIEAEIIKVNRLCPLDAAPALRSLRKTGRLVSIEDVCHVGSVGTALLAEAVAAGVPIKKVCHLDLRNGLIAHGSVAELHKRLGMDADGIVCAVREMLHEEVPTGSAGV